MCLPGKHVEMFAYLSICQPQPVNLDHLFDRARCYKNFLRRNIGQNLRKFGRIIKFLRKQLGQNQQKVWP